MSGAWLSDATITLKESVETWPQAPGIGGKPLLDAGIIAPEYIMAIVRQYHTLYVLAPGRAMAHARPEEGTKGLSLSLLKRERGVSFGAGGIIFMP